MGGAVVRGRPAGRSARTFEDARTGHRGPERGVRQEWRFEDDPSDPTARVRGRAVPDAWLERMRHPGPALRSCFWWVPDAAFEDARFGGAGRDARPTQGLAYRGAWSR